MQADREKPATAARKGGRPETSRGTSQPAVPAAVLPPAVLPVRESPAAHWTFLTNHSHVLLLLSRNPSLVLREVALQVGITERAVQRIIADLEAGGIIEREKVGRQNHYRILVDQRMRHPIESHRTIGEFLALIDRAEK